MKLLRKSFAGMLLGMMVCANLFVSAREAEAEAEGESAVPIAVVKEVEGSLEVDRGGKILAGKAGDPLYVGDKLVTKLTDRALIEFAQDKSLVKITYDSTLLMTGQETAENDEARIMLLKGLMWGKKDLPDPPLRIRTPIAVLAVRGTEYFVKVPSPSRSEVVVKEGAVDISYEGQNVRAGNMSRVVLEKGKPPLVEGIAEKLLNEEWVQRFA